MTADTPRQEVELNTLRIDGSAVPPADALRPAAPARVSAPAAAAATPVPAAPPADALAELDAAAGVLGALDAHGLSLRLSLGEGAVGFRLETADGAVVRSLEPSQVLDALAGTARGVLFDAQG